ncbi:molybdate ABC transporter substrate-binding protein [Neobacillus sp. CF12]|uniref:molybdate ABC transporter substrate-binding protein n=1 Tax=Neobacillus sp. CF12 TaxID=3055864 RepID=UPI0025A2270E|nr:molybdate ABC transporter substrate-binding protein [Neobacillus sp. CF12]MDM5331433.1 molybdate ABC transporter substrate-binding protein [Neobacillus sp. CF12]
MTKSFFLAGIAIIVLLGISACSPKESHQTKPVELTISAAASLNESLIEIKKIFEKENQQIKILYNIGSSGALKQQILQGAPVDLFLSASQEHFIALTQEGLIDKQNQTELLGNKLVLITNKENSAKINGFIDLNSGQIKKIAIGIPESVPAGKYAKQTLQNSGIWEQIHTKVIQTKDVRQVLTYVETGNVDAGIVYMTDVKVSDKVKVVAVAEEQSHDPIIYPGGIITSTSNKKEAELFLSYLQSNTAKTIFEKYGFIVLD